MSWLGNSFSQIGGQISNFTKEVLTEGTEEVDDHATELRIAKAKITELELLCASQQTEVEKLQRSHGEVAEKFESSELQINAISSEYRELLQSKETEVNELKQRQNDLLESNTKLVQSVQTVATTAPSSVSYAGSQGHVYGSDEHDLHDVISSQHEINRLRGEVQRLEAEAHHWKQQAQGATQQGEQPGISEDHLSNLQAQIKELEQRLSCEVNQHQHELAALQDVHSQKLGALKKRHKDDVAKYKTENAELQQRLGQSEAGEVSRDVASQDRLRHLEEINRKLSSDLEQTHAADREKARLLEQLQSEHQELRGQTSQLQKECSGVKEDRQSLLEEIDALTEERQQLKIQLSTAESTSGSPARQLDESGGLNLSPIKSGFQASTPMHPPRRLADRSAPSELDTTTDASLQEHHLDEQVQSLQAQIDAYEKEIKHFELVKSDWQMEKEALEEVLLKMREQLREKEETLTAVQSQKGLAEAKRRGKKRAKRKPSEGTESSEVPAQPQFETNDNDADEDYEDISDIEEKYLAELEKQKDRVADLERKLTENAGSSAQVLEEMHHLKQEVETRNTELQARAALLQANEQELHKLSALLEQKDSMLLEKDDQLQQHTSVLAERESQIVDLSTQLDQSQTTQSQETELHNLARSLEARNTEMAEMREEKETLEMSLEELDNQHQEAMAALIQKRDQLLTANQQLEAQLTDLQSKSVDISAGEGSEQLKEKIQATEQELESVSKEKERLLAEIAEVKQKAETVALTLNDLHMDKQELEKSVRHLKEESKSLHEKLGAVSQEKRALESACHQLENQLASSTQQLDVLQQGAEDGPSKAELQATLSQVQDNLNRSNMEKHEVQNKAREMEQKVHFTSRDMELLEADKRDLQKKIEESQQRLVQQKEELTAAFKKQAAELNMKQDALQSQKQSLEKDLSQSEQNLQEQAKKYEAYIKELTEARDLDTSGLQAEHERLLKACHEKDMKVSSLEVKCEQLASEVEDAKDLLQSTIDGQQQITNMLSDNDAEMSRLQAENQTFSDHSDDLNLQLKHSQVELDRLTEVDKLYKQSLEDCRKLRADVDTLRTQLKQASSKEAGEVVESQTLGIITELEGEIKTLSKKAEERDASLEKQHKELQALRDAASQQEQTTTELTSVVAKLKEDKLETDELIKDLQDANQRRSSELLMMTDKFEKASQGLDRAKAFLDSTQLKVLENGLIESLPTQNGVSVVDYDKGTKSDDVISTDDSQRGGTVELEKLRKIIAQKDNIIMELKDSNVSLLRLLEERSLVVHGDNTLLDIHRLEQEVKGLRLEKEQMMSVLSEKSRECSSSKAEVHRLMNVISAEKTALAKLQQDNQELLKSKEKPNPNQDMTKEAIRKLSQIVRDKDLEIESLGQKNGTLLQVLQESSTEGTQISSLIQDKENLAKQVVMFQNDREHIISALNIKHQESLAYHTEIQRLNSVLSEDREKNDQLQQEHSNLLQQHERRQKAFLKTQNELLNYKHKYKQTETSYREILRRQRQSSDVDGDPPADGETESEVSSLDEPHSVATAAASYELSLEVEQLKTILQSHEDAFTEKDKIISEKEESLREKDRCIMDKEKLLNEKDRLLGESNVKSHRMEEMLRSKDVEVAGMKKQQESAAFQLRGLQTEHKELKHDSEKLHDRTAALQQESGMLREANNKLSLSVNDKDFEISALKEKCTTLTTLLQDQSTSGEGNAEVDRLMKEMEVIQGQAQVLKRDRDQFAAAIQQQQVENQELKTEYKKVQEKEHKLIRELERLRNHLLQIEETYTREALEAEEREKALRNKLAVAEERALCSTTAVESANHAASKQMDNLQLQLHALASQRDKALLDLSTANETASQYATSLSNLQMVLEQFQHEREMQQVAEMDRYQRELEQARQQNKQLKENISGLKAELEEATDALEAAQRLSEQLDRKEEMIHALREEVQLRENQLKQVEEDVAKLTSSSEAKVDREMVKSLLVSYFHSPASKRHEVLQVIGKVLGFTHHDMEEIDPDGSKKGWLGGLFGRVTSTPPTTPQRKPDKSFSELFVKFLERESSPQPQLKLPAEAMAREEQERQHQRQQRNKPFNPFAVPVSTGASAPPLSPGGRPAPLPLNIRGISTAGSRPQEAPHILMKPISASLPLFPTVAASDSRLPPSGGDSGRASVASSGRSTPSSAVLRDVLQQQ